MKSKLFYKNLKSQRKSMHLLLGNEALFKDVPADWSIVVADIEDSTTAVNNGLHDSVNLAATGSIIAVLNELKKSDSKFKAPYFFGGDGATFLIPEIYVAQVSKILERYAEHVKQTMYLTLRIGKIQVAEVYKKGYTLRLAKSKMNAFLTVPVALGLGIKYAEGIIKDEFEKNAVKKLSKIPVNLKGMECRWDEIEPENADKKVICLIVNAVHEKHQSRIFSGILREIQTSFGSFESRAPIAASKLRLNTTIHKIKREMKARIGKFKLGYLLKNWSLTYFGKFYFKYFKNGKRYLFKVSQLSDTLMIDGSINTVMSGTQLQIDRLQNYLDDLEKAKEINYGLHDTYASIMSCYVQDREDNHIHFVDGTEGGYTSASKIIKSKLIPFTI